MLDQTDILDPKLDLNLLRARVGMVFQKPTPFPMTIYENIAFGIRLYEKISKSEMDGRVEKALPAARCGTRSRSDAICTSLFRELLTYMMEDPRNISFCIHLMFCAKNIERIGDHATNIAETVFYMIEGQQMLDKRPKGDMTNFATTVPNS